MLNYTDQIIVLPRAGCTGCISDATYFILENYTTFENTCIVITEIDDIKSVLASLPSEFLNSSKVYIDKGNALSTEDLKSAYPYILTVRTGKVQARKILISIFALPQVNANVHPDPECMNRGATSGDVCDGLFYPIEAI